MKDNKNNIWIYIVLVLSVLLIGVGIFYYFYNSNKIINNNNDENTSKIEDKDDDRKYLKILDNKKVLRSDLNLSEHAIVNYSKTDRENGIVFLDIVEPEFQFETHYLLCYDKDGNKILDIRDFYDEDNDNNRYKYNGNFEYDEDNDMLTLYAKLFLGESDESAGAAFDGKFISDLTADEKKILENYSDEVKYDYKYENNKMIFVEKKEISKLKNNDYYKYQLNN